MRRGQKFLVFYFLFFGALSVIAFIPGGALVVLLLTAMALPLFGGPGWLVIASPTILIYSVSLVPMLLALTAPRGRIWFSVAAAFVPVALAIGPGLGSQQEASLFGARMSKDDFSRPSIAKPRMIELIGDGKSGLFVYGQTVGDEKASCNETCRRLLFNGEADWVRMTRIPDLYMNKRSGSTKSVTYRIEHRDSCPQLYPDGTRIEKAVRDRLVAGECVIADDGANAAPDAVVKFTTRYSNQQYPPKPPDDGPAQAIIETMKDLRIVNRQDGELVEVVQRTEIIAQTLTIPFYIGAEMHMQGGYNGPVIGRRKTVINPIDLAQTLRGTFGYEIAEISAAPPEDVGKVAARILALPPETTPVLSAQQQDALNDELSLIAKQPMLADDDVGFVRRVIADRRVAEPKLGIVLQRCFANTPSVSNHLSRSCSIELAPRYPKTSGTTNPCLVGHWLTFRRIAYVPIATRW